MRYLLILYLTFASAFCSGQVRRDNRLVGVTLRTVRYEDQIMPLALSGEFTPPFFPIPDQGNGIRIGLNMGLQVGYRFN